MEYDKKLLQDVKRIMLVRFPRFGAQIAATNLEFSTDFHTAATDGKNVYFNPNYFASLSDDDKLFLVAHEFMHLKFEHMYRIMDKNGQKRDFELWNIATDAIINANLERDGFKIKEGYVNMPEALNYSAEEFYEKLLREKQEQQQRFGNNGQEGQNRQQQSGNNQNQGQSGQQQQGQKSQAKSQNGQQGQEQKQQDSFEQNQKDQSQSSKQSGDSGQKKQEGQNRQQQLGNNQNQGQSGQQQQGQKSQAKSQNGQQGQEQKQQDSFEQNQKDQSQSSKQSGNFCKQSQGEQHQEQGAGGGEQFADDHSLWEKAFEESQEQKNGQKKKSAQNDKLRQSKTSKNSQLDSNAQIPEFDASQFDEKAEFQENRKERLERAKRYMEKMKDQELKNTEVENIEFGRLGEAKPILDWKLLLRREVEKTETIWSQRKSIAENNYAYRLEELDEEDEAETEVMIDVSGSISTTMVKNFIRQLKPILKSSKLYVGFFADYATKGFIEIKTSSDIDNLRIKRPGYGTNIDAAARAFSKKKSINKIVFTDGDCYECYMPKKDLKGTNIIWLVYGDVRFKPCCGKVIKVDQNDLQKMVNLSKTKSNEPDLSM